MWRPSVLGGALLSGPHPVLDLGKGRERMRIVNSVLIGEDGADESTELDWRRGLSRSGY
jgi:hypothetical protein